MKLNIIKRENLIVRIPETPNRYRANCHKDWGVFVTGETKGLNILKASEQGLVKGNWVELALCLIDNKILTFEPDYINEQFIEIWGIPVAGEMKTQFAEKASELITFLIHRESKEKLINLVEIFNRTAFNEWVEKGMNEDISEFATQKLNEYYFSNIFRFELMQKQSKNYTYHIVGITSRPPENDLEKSALDIAKEIYTSYPQYCQDPRLIKNHEQCLAILGAQENALLEAQEEPKSKAKKSK